MQRTGYGGTTNMQPCKGERICRMSQSLSQVYIHLIFSTKHRVPLLTPDIYEGLREYMGGTLRTLESPSLVLGVASDHVHVLFCLSRKMALTNVIEEIKRSSSKWIKTQGSQFADMYWQAGYGAFSVSASRLDAVKRYILNQEEHHRRVSFQDEFRKFLKEYKVDYDERYVWD